MQVNITYKDIWKMAYPVIIGSVSLTVLNITDTIFLGRVSETALGASALGGVFYFVMVMAGMAMGTGTQIQIARRAGEKNHKAIGEIFDHSLYIFLGLGILQFLVMGIFSGYIFGFLISEKDIRDACLEFLKYRSLGVLFLMPAFGFRSFYSGIARPNVYGIYSAVMAITNVILAYALIFGKLGLPEMGIAGAGLASSLTELVGLLYLVGYTFFYHYPRTRVPRQKQTEVIITDAEDFNLFRFRNFRWTLIKKTLKLSAPLVIQNVISMGAWFLFFVFVEKIGKHALAISNITRSLYMIAMTPFWGFAVASNSMISNIIGQGRQSETGLLLIRIIKMSSLIALGIICLILLFPKTISLLFTSDMQLISDSLGCFRIISLATIVFSFAIVSISAVSGTGATRTALYIEIGAIAMYMLYLYLVVFYFHASLEWAWTAELLYWLFTGLTSYLYLKSRRWEKIKI